MMAVSPFGSEPWKQKSNKSNQVALTFDDGPDPVYTPKILDILNSRGARATFFVLAAKAKIYPQTVRAILGEGHHIALHGLRHRPHLTMTKECTLKEMKKASDLLAELTGHNPIYYRPPWGIMNPWTLTSAQQLKLEIVLWSCDSLDWLWGIRPQAIVQRILSCPQLPGGIILCHDGSFVPHRQKTLLSVLPKVLDELKYRGYQLVDLPTLLSDETP